MPVDEIIQEQAHALEELQSLPHQLELAKLTEKISRMLAGCELTFLMQVVNFIASHRLSLVLGSKQDGCIVLVREDQVKDCKRQVEEMLTPLS